MKKFLIILAFLPFSLFAQQSVLSSFNGYGDIVNVIDVDPTDSLFTIDINNFYGSPRFQPYGPWIAQDVQVGMVMWVDCARFVITNVNSASFSTMSIDVKVPSVDWNLGVATPLPNSRCAVVFEDQYLLTALPAPADGNSGALSGINNTLFACMLNHYSQALLVTKNSVNEITDYVAGLDTIPSEAPGPNIGETWRNSVGQLFYSNGTQWLTDKEIKFSNIPLEGLPSYLYKLGIDTLGQDTLYISNNGTFRRFQSGLVYKEGYGINIFATDSIEVDTNQIATQYDISLLPTGIDTFQLNNDTLKLSLVNDFEPFKKVILPVVGINSGTGISTSSTSGIHTITNTAPDQIVSITGAGISNVTGTYPNFTVTSTEVDGSVTNEGSLSVGAGTGTTSIIQSNTSGSNPITLTGAGITTVNETGNTITITSTEVDGSTTNELQTLSTVSNTVTLSNSGGSFTIAGAGINTVGTVGSTITVTGTEIDGSISNEGILGVGAGSASSSTILSNTSTSTPITLNAAGIISITETANSNGGSITLTGTEVDGSITNEIQDLSLSGQTLSLSSDPTSVTLPVIGITAGTGISTSSTSGNFTVTNTGDLSNTNELQSLSTNGTAGNISISSGNTITLNVNDADASPTNELQTLSVATNTATLSNSGGSVTIAGSGINTVGTAGTTITVTGTEVDGSVSNELQTLSTGTNTLTLSNGGGTVTVDTDPNDDITGSGVSGRVPYFNGTQTVTSSSNFLYDNTGSGRLSVGGVSGTGSLNLYATQGDNYFNHETYSTTAGNTNYWLTRKSRSATLGTITETTDGDFLGALYFQGVDNTNNFDYGVKIFAIQSGAAGTTVPTRLTLNTFSSTGENFNQLNLHPNSNVSIGTSLSDAKLRVASSFATSATWTAQFHNSSTNNALMIRDDGNIGLGTNDPSARLTIRGAAGGINNITTLSTNSDNIINSETYSATDGNGSLFFLNKSSSSTLGTRTATENGEFLGGIWFRGVDNTGAFDTGVRINAIQDGTSGATVPAKLSFITSSSTGQNTNQLNLNANNTVSIGTAAALARLHVVGSGSTSSTWTAQFHNSAGNNNALMIRDDGNVGIGTSSPAVKFEIRGNTSDNLANSFRVTNNSSQSLFDVRNDGQVTLGIGNSWFNYVDGVFTPNPLGRLLSLRFSASGATATGYGLLIANGQVVNRDFTTGSGGGLRLAEGFAPTSGAGIYNAIQIDGVINQTGGANGVTRGLNIDHTLTSASNYRAIEWSNSLGFGLYGSGTAPNLLNGRLSIPAGTYDLPALSFVGDANTGIFRPVEDNIEIKTGTNNAIVLENRATNLKTNSENLTLSSPLNQNIAVTIPGSIMAPDGTLSANLAVPNTTLNQHRFGFLINMATPSTISIYAKAAGYNFLSMGEGGSVSGENIIFNLSNGTFSGSATNYTAQMESVGNGWYRCILISTVTGVAVNLYRFIIVRNANNTAAYAGDGTSGVYLWGNQIEEGLAATSYIKTEATTVTRPQAVSVLGPNVYGTLKTKTLAAPSLQDLSFNTQNTPRLSILSGGNIGIGTVTPTRTLDINGETRIRDLTTTTATNLVGSDADGVLSNVSFASAVSQGGGLTGNGVTNYLAQYNSSNTLDTTGVIWTGGRLGIGTSAPARTLHVAGEARITDLTTDTPTRIVGADTDGDLGEISLGSGLSITSGTISVTNPISASEVFIESSTATTIDLDANTGVVKDVNGTNASFTYPTDLSRLSVYKNGIRLSRTGSLTTRDFSVNTTTNEITFSVALVSTDRIVIVKI